MKKFYFALFFIFATTAYLCWWPKIDLIVNIIVFTILLCCMIVSSVLYMGSVSKYDD